MSESFLLFVPGGEVAEDQNRFLAGVDPRGLVYAIDEPSAEDPTSWSVVVHDDLAPRFADADESIRLRGATRVVIE